jgi:hypothetical protein
MIGDVGLERPGGVMEHMRFHAGTFTPSPGQSLSLFALLRDAWAPVFLLGVFAGAGSSWLGSSVRRGDDVWLQEAEGMVLGDPPHALKCGVNERVADQVGLTRVKSGYLGLTRAISGKKKNSGVRSQKVLTHGHTSNPEGPVKISARAICGYL